MFNVDDFTMNRELEIRKAVTRRHQCQQKSQRSRLSGYVAESDTSSSTHIHTKAQKAIARLFSPYWLASIPLAATIVVVWNTAAVAQEGEVLTLEEVQGTLNAIWVLVAAVLVIFMNAGFGMLETGFCRQKNAVNILAKNLILQK